MVHSAEVGSIPVPDMSALIARLANGCVYLSGDRCWEVDLDGTDKLLKEAATSLRAIEIEVRMAAERLSIHAQKKSSAPGETYLRSSMAGIAGDLFSALRSSTAGYEAAGEVSPNLKAKAQGEGG